MVTVEELNQRQARLSERQEELRSQLPGQEGPTLRSPGETRNVSRQLKQRQTRRRQIQQQIQDLEQQKQRLEEAKTVEAGGLQFRRGTDFEQVAAELETEINTRDEPLGVAVLQNIGGLPEEQFQTRRTPGAEDLPADERETAELSQEQQEFLEDLIEFEEQEEEISETRSQQRRFERIQETEGEQAATEFLLEDPEAQELREEAFTQQDIEEIERAREDPQTQVIPAEGDIEGEVGLRRLQAPEDQPILQPTIQQQSLVQRDIEGVVDTERGVVLTEEDELRRITDEEALQEFQQAGQEFGRPRGPGDPQMPEPEITQIQRREEPGFLEFTAQPVETRFTTQQVAQQIEEQTGAPEGLAQIGAGATALSTATLRGIGQTGQNLAALTGLIEPVTEEQVRTTGRIGLSGATSIGEGFAEIVELPQINIEEPPTQPRPGETALITPQLPQIDTETREITGFTEQQFEQVQVEPPEQPGTETFTTGFIGESFEAAQQSFAEDAPALFTGAGTLITEQTRQLAGGEASETFGTRLTEGFQTQLEAFREQPTEIAGELIEEVPGILLGLGSVAATTPSTSVQVQQTPPTVQDSVSADVGTQPTQFNQDLLPDFTPQRRRGTARVAPDTLQPSAPRTQPDVSTSVDIDTTVTQQGSVTGFFGSAAFTAPNIAAPIELPQASAQPRPTDVVPSRPETVEDIRTVPEELTRPQPLPDVQSRTRAQALPDVQVRAIPNVFSRARPQSRARPRPSLFPDLEAEFQDELEAGFADDEEEARFAPSLEGITQQITEEGTLEELSSEVFTGIGIRGLPLQED